MKHFSIYMISWLICYVPALAQHTLEPVEVARIATFAEAPVFDKEGNLYVSEPFRGPVTKITPEGDTSEWFATEGANGHKILSDGNHLLCDRIRKVILKLDANGEELSEFVTECGGKPLRAPNDIVLDNQGGFYFTDPAGEEDSIGRIGYVDAGGKSHFLAEWVGFPNGIALAPDGKSLYVGDFRHNEILVFPILSPANVGPKNLFAKLPDLGEEFGGPDGILCDEDGNLFVAHLGTGKIQVLDPQGKLMRSLPAGQLWVSNLTFGGPDGNTLFTTGCPKQQIMETGVVYQLDLSLAGGEASRK
ncbi:gluconolactonase [Catalinimonas alkaloidigena]|uniref:SMP-30/gluconolactonase/LRE family protein n=1 Tax=Catalinimonas alkaloidigena TaxID=1075417 RepID=UPI002405BBCA|nr:SMP-30/gluconolactonase/LRE family protein [Catalinimonas alkaloidigena]MDF9798509.1 gluconolactonase [Catalinimonas alkaloidigena]